MHQKKPRFLYQRTQIILELAVKMSVVLLLFDICRQILKKSRLLLVQKWAVVDSGVIIYTLPHIYFRTVLLQLGVLQYNFTENVIKIKWCLVV